MHHVSFDSIVKIQSLAQFQVVVLSFVYLLCKIAIIIIIIIAQFIPLIESDKLYWLCFL